MHWSNFCQYWEYLSYIFQYKLSGFRFYTIISAEFLVEFRKSMCNQLCLYIHWWALQKNTSKLMRWEGEHGYQGGKGGSVTWLICSSPFWAVILSFQFPWHPCCSLLIKLFSKIWYLAYFIYRVIIIVCLQLWIVLFSFKIIIKISLIVLIIFIALLIPNQVFQP